MYNKILLAADGSENSLRAANEAIKISKLSTPKHLEIACVIKFDDSKTQILHSTSESELKNIRQQKLQPIEQLFQAEKLDYSIKFLHGEPGPALVKYANNEKFDIVIIGSRGLNTLQEMVLGSVSHKVAKHVLCPVLIVK